MAMHRYSLKLREFIASRKRYTQRAVSSEANVSEQQVSNWHNVKGFDDWLSEQMLHEAHRIYPRALLASAHRCEMTADPREVEILARLLNKVPTLAITPGLPDGSSAVMGSYTLNLLVPRPAVDGAP